MVKEQDTESKKTVEQDAQTASAPEAKAVTQKTPWPLITIGVFATIIVVALIALAASALLHDRRATDQVTSRSGHMGMNNSDFGSRGGSTNRPDGMSGGRGSFMTPTASGVITAINGDTITVAGGGKQVTVKKTSTTVISGDETAIAVNDTVVVMGTKNSDGSVTATRIMIRNNQTFGRPTADDTSQTPGA